MKTQHHIIKYLIGLLLICLLPSVNAGDITNDIRKGVGRPDLSDGGYFAVGIYAVFYNDLLVEEDENNKEDSFKVGITLNGSYRYKGLFAEADIGSKYVNLGYDLWSNANWSIDLLAASAQGSYYRNDDNLSEKEKNEKLAWKRTTWYVGTGFRATGYFDNYMLQFRLVTDTHSGNGITSTINLGKSWQLRNWNFHAIIGAEYASEKTNNYWFGIAEEDATDRFSAYKANASIGLTGEIGVDYPISEKWVSRTSLRYAQIPDEINMSPIIDDPNKLNFITSISYVF